MWPWTGSLTSLEPHFLICEIMQKKNSLVIPQKVKHRITTRSSNSTSEYIPKRSKNQNSERYLHTNVQSSIVHHNQKAEATQISIDRWMNKHVVPAYNGFSLKKKWNSAMSYKMCEPWKHYAQWNKAVTKGCHQRLSPYCKAVTILYDSTYMRYRE